MLKIRYVILLLGMLLSSVASAQVSIGIGLPHVSIGINLPVYPQLVRVPGYPVYYAPQLQANYFFYDGMYWVYQNDEWYASSWYDGPWGFVDPEAVPLFILRIPVRYYRQPPSYFHGWRPDAPPHWGDHWGPNWEQRRSGWDKWNRRAAPAPAPLPVYQRQYSGDRYPRQVQQQHQLQQRNYRYQPRDPVVRRSYQEQAVPRAPAQRERQGAPEQRNFRQQEMQRSAPKPAQRGGENMQRPAPAAPQQGRPAVQERRQPPQPNVNQREQQMQRSPGREGRQPGKDAAREPKRGQDQGQGQDRGRGRDRNE